MAEAPLQERLSEARRAMEGEEWQKKRGVKTAALAKRRDEARRAMEGSERRTKRQALETAERQAALKIEAAARTAAEKSTAADKQQAALRAAAEAQGEAAARAETARRTRVTDSTEKIEKIKASPVRMSPVRTFKTDLAEAVAGGATLTSAVMGEEAKRRGLSPAPKPGHPWLIVMMTFLFLSLGAGAIGYLYFYQRAPGGLPSTASTTSGLPDGKAGGTIINPDDEKFVFTDEQIPVALGKTGPPTELITSLRHALNNGEIKSGRLARLQLTTVGQTLSFKTFLERFQLPLPDPLARVLEPSFLLGRYDSNQQPAAFLILKTTNYDQSSAGLRLWEKDLITIFQRLTGRINLASTTPVFQDQLRNNLELRVLKKDGQTILLYGFLDQTTIAITETETALDEIITRRAAVQ